MIAELHAERTAIDEAVVVLERLARGRSGRRGRPPAWMAFIRANSSNAPKTTTRTLSAETRKRMAEAQKRRWAAYRKAQEA
ncbi:MAG TPA: hypothetical protein VMG40_20380 [Bryobacteraceae bacterium]|nr:hypothetical protein [Bryobacteraceae bacterium]